MLMINIVAMSKDCIVYDRHSCPIHWDSFAYDKHTCAMRNKLAMH